MATLDDRMADIRARLEQGARDVQLKAEQMRRLGEQIDAVTVTVESADGLVRATVTSAGSLADLDISDRLSGRRGAEIAAAVRACVRDAQAKLPARLAEIAGTVLGEDDALARRMAEELRRRFPAGPDQAGTPPEQPAAPPADDDIGAQSFLVRVRPEKGFR